MTVQSLVELFGMLAEPHVTMETLRKLMGRFVACLWASETTFGPAQGGVVDIYQRMALALDSEPEFQHPHSPLGRRMAAAVARGIVGLETNFWDEGDDPAVPLERDVMPLVRRQALRRLLRGMNLFRLEVRRLAHPEVPIAFFWQHVPRYVYGVSATYDLAWKQDVPQGFVGALVELLVRAMVGEPILVQEIMRTAVGESWCEGREVGRLVSRFQRAVEQGLSNEPYHGERLVTGSEIHGPAKFAARNLRDRRFVDTAASAAELVEELAA